MEVSVDDIKDVREVLRRDKPAMKEQAIGSSKNGF